MPPTPPAKTGGGGALGGLKHKIGPQPMWAWMAEVLGLALAYALYKQRKAASTASQPDTTGTVPAGQVPDVIIQNELQGPGTDGDTTGPPAPPTGGGTKQPKPKPPTPRGFPPRGPAPKPKPSTPSGVKTSGVSKSGFSAAWNPVAGASDYIVRITYQDKLVKQVTTKEPKVTLSGLDPDHTYTFHVAAAGPGGNSSETNGPAVKTRK